MPKWYQIAERQFHSAGLLEPQTKMAQLRAFLPVIEAALEHGAYFASQIRQRRVRPIIPFREYKFRDVVPQFSLAYSRRGLAPRGEIAKGYLFERSNGPGSDLAALRWRLGSAS